MFKQPTLDATHYSLATQRPKDHILLHLPNIDPAHYHLYLQQQNYDLKIMHHRQEYLVHKEVLSSHSELIKQFIGSRAKYLVVPEAFKPTVVRGVIESLYGQPYQLSRHDVINALPVLDFFKITRFERVVEQEILTDIDEYDLFQLLAKARQLGISTIEEACYQQFEQEGYQQLRYMKLQLLECQEDVFIDIIRRHQYRKAANASFGLHQTDIDEVIQDFCNHKKMNPSQKEALKQTLTEEFIHTDQTIIGSMPLFSSDLPSTCPSQPGINVLTPLDESSINYASRTSLGSSQVGPMINGMNFTTMHKRRKSSRSSDHSQSGSMGICSDMIVIKENNKKITSEMDELKKVLSSSISTLKEANSELQTSNQSLINIQNSLGECYREMMQSKRQLMVIEAKVRSLSQGQAEGEQGQDGSVLDEQMEVQSVIMLNDDNANRLKMSHIRQQFDRNPSEPIKKELKNSIIESKWISC